MPGFAIEVSFVNLNLVKITALQITSRKYSKPRRLPILWLIYRKKCFISCFELYLIFNQIIVQIKFLGFNSSIQ